MCKCLQGEGNAVYHIRNRHQCCNQTDLLSFTESQIGPMMIWYNRRLQQTRLWGSDIRVLTHTQTQSDRRRSRTRSWHPQHEVMACNRYKEGETIRKCKGLNHDPALGLWELMCACDSDTLTCSRTLYISSPFNTRTLFWTLCNTENNNKKAR